MFSHAMIPKRKILIKEKFLKSSKTTRQTILTLNKKKHNFVECLKLQAMIHLNRERISQISKYVLDMYN